MSEALATRSPSPEPGSRGRIPGEAGIWVFVLGDMTMFAAFFGCFTHDRGHHVALFTAAQSQLRIGFGAVNTCLLLTGSLFVVWAVNATRRDALAEARRWLGLAWTCGAVFGVNKVLEYADKIAHDVTPATNLYFMYFYMFTGLHALHLLIGLIVLGRMRAVCARPALSAANHRTLGIGATYWHLVDLLWVVLFALLYLMV